MTDRELLELSAKAAGIDKAKIPDHIEWDTGRCLQRGWNPLTDDGDALRLAVKLGISLETDANIEVACDEFGGGVRKRG